MQSRKLSLLLLQLLLVNFCSVVFSSSETSEEPEEEADKVQIVFQNELSDPVTVYYEGHHERIAQGEPLEAKGGHQSVDTFSGHKFSYDFGGERHFVIAPKPNPENKPILTTLLAGRTEIGVQCLVSVDEGESEELNMRIVPWWAPIGASWFLALVRIGYYDGVAINRVVPKFLAQFGIAADTEVRKQWQDSKIIDDDPLHEPISFVPGMISFAGSGPSTRNTEIFVVMPDTPQRQLDYFGTNVWEKPFGVIDDMDQSVLARVYSYGDMPPTGSGPDPQKIYLEDGYDYLKTEFPELNYIEKCYVLEIETETNDEL